MDIINENMKKMISLCKENNRNMPTEIKLVYNVKSNSLEADYKYEPVYSNLPDKFADDIAQEWFEELRMS